MPTQITEIPDEERGKIVLRVAGSLLRDDALLIEKVALEIREDRRREVAIDLSDLDFIDSESAPIVRRLSEHGFDLEGVEFFLQTIVNDAEKVPGK